MPSDKEVLEAMEAAAYKDNTKTRLLEFFRAGESDADSLKNDYGNGVSVKFIFSNVSSKHFLIYEDACIHSGKDLDDPYVRFPREVRPLRSEAGFHAKRDASAAGSFGCVQYTIRDNVDSIKAYVAIGWGQPYWGSFRYQVGVQQQPFGIRSIANDCFDNSDDKHGIGDEKFQKAFRVTATKVNDSTALLHLVGKLDEIAKQTEEEL